MFTSLYNFFYETFFHRPEIKFPESKNVSDESTAPKRLKLSDCFWDSNSPSGRRSFPLSLSMQKENADISDDEECCIIAEMPRRKKPVGFLDVEKEEAAVSKTTSWFSSWPSLTKTVSHKSSNDVEEVKPVNNTQDKSLVLKPNTRNKFFSSARSPISFGKMAKSRASFKTHLRRRMNFLQESYRLSEKMQYVQLLRSQALLDSHTNRTPSRAVSSESEKIPVIDLTDSDDNTKSDSESLTSSEDQDVQIVGVYTKYTGVRSFQDILKISPINAKQENKGILCKFSNNDPFHSNTKVLSDHTINLLDDNNDDEDDDYDYGKDETSNFDTLGEKLKNYVQITSHSLQEGDTFKEYDLPELTYPQEMKIKSALIPYPKQEVLVNGFNLQITRQDMQTLKGLNWLNDVIIDFYMNLIMERSKLNSRLPKVYAFNTFFYPKLFSKGNESLLRWTKHVDIFSFDVLLVPVHLGMHWCLSIIDFRSKSIQYYDSIGSPNDKCLELLLSYLKAESLHKKNTVFYTNNWKTQNVEDIPQQMNGSDCGVFSCMFAEFLTRDCSITFSQEDMPYFRKKMIIELLEKQLLT